MKSIDGAARKLINQTVEDLRASVKLTEDVDVLYAAERLILNGETSGYGSGKTALRLIQSRAKQLGAVKAWQPLKDVTMLSARRLFGQSLYHAVPTGSEKALCGAGPNITCETPGAYPSAWHLIAGERLTCKTCIRIIENIAINNSKPDENGVW